MMDMVQMEHLGAEPPHNAEAEQAMLATLLLYPQHCGEFMDSLDEQDFYVPKHRYLYKIFATLHASGADIALESVCSRIDGIEAMAAGFSDAGDAQKYVADLSTMACKASQARTYFRMLKGESLRRRLIDEHSRQMETMRRTSWLEAEGVAAEGAEAIIALASEGAHAGRFRSAGACTEETLARVEASRAEPDFDRPIPTGFADLDRLLDGGLRRKEYAACGGRSGDGKSIIGADIAFHAAEAGFKVAYFSLEMPAEHVFARRLAATSGVPLSRIRRSAKLSDADIETLYDAAMEISGLNLWLDDTDRIPCSQLCALARQMKARRGLDLVVVDYLQLMRPNPAKGQQRTREMEVSEMSKSLKTLCKELDCAVLVLVQLNRGVDGNRDGRPETSNIRESASIELDADVVMLLHRARRRSGDYSRVDVHVDKVRHGRPGTVHLLCHGPCTTMYGVCLSGTDGNGFDGPDAEGVSDGWNGDLPAFVPNNAGQARPLPLQGGFHAEF